MTVHAQADTTPNVRRLAPLWGAALDRFPVVVFVLVYVFSGYIGAVGIILSGTFRDLYQYFSGAQLPEVTNREVWLALLLLHAGPLLFWLGFEFARRLLKAWRTSPEIDKPAFRVPQSVVTYVAVAAFLVSAIAAGWSIARAGGSANFLAWLDYNNYVYARWRLFDRLGFFEFVNLYTVLPLTAAYLILVVRRFAVAAASSILVVLLQFPLANRKALLTSMILIAAAGYVYLYVGKAPRRLAATHWHGNLFLVAPCALYLSFVGLTVLPVVSETSRPFQSMTPSPGPSRVPTSPTGAVVQSDPPPLIASDRRLALAFYLALSPVTRTSISAIVYPATFPRLRPYYHLDLGLDILRIGTMPDDNLVVYRLLWPEHHRGSITAPFHFVLYSQGGAMVSMIGSLIVGGLTGVCWALVLHRPRPSAEVAVFGALVIVFAVFLTIDSLRNSTVVSYGLVWGAAALLSLWSVSYALSHALGRLCGLRAA